MIHKNIFCIIYYLHITQLCTHICVARTLKSTTKITIILWESKFTRFYGGDDYMSY